MVSFFGIDNFVGEGERIEGSFVGEGERIEGSFVGEGERMKESLLGDGERAKGSLVGEGARRVMGATMREDCSRALAILVGEFARGTGSLVGEDGRRRPASLVGVGNDLGGRLDAGTGGQGCVGCGFWGPNDCIAAELELL